MAIRIYKRQALLAASGVFCGATVALSIDIVIRSAHVLPTHYVYMQLIMILLICCNGIAFGSSGFIMINVMRSEVVERAWEFSMRLQVGARRRDILYQLLYEAFLLSLPAGILGSAFGMVIGSILTALLQLSWAVQPVSLILLMMASVASGAIGGLYPAVTAAQNVSKG